MSGGGTGNEIFLSDDAVAAYALLPGVEHAPVVLIRRQHFVARLEIDAELRDLQRFAGVARDGELLGIAAGFGREPRAHRSMFGSRMRHMW